MISVPFTLFFEIFLYTIFFSSGDCLFYCDNSNEQCDNMSKKCQNDFIIALVIGIVAAIGIIGFLIYFLNHTIRLLKSYR